MTAPSNIPAVDPFALDVTRTVLSNGLVVITHEDHSAPEVSLSVCYRVGSKDEGPGQSGSAHLFEHLMFTGSKNLPGSFAEHMTEAGASLVNAYTTPDHSCFFASFPPSTLDFALYAEADRMGSFCERLDAGALAQQQAIVLEEKAQREGGSLGGLSEMINRGIYPPGHPYRHTVIGSAEDVAGMTLDAARDWHRRFYAPDNAAIIIAGPIDTAAALASAEAHFAHIAPSANNAGIDVWIPAMPTRRRHRIDAAVGHGGLLYLAWPVAEAIDPSRTHLELIAALIAGNETAPLHHALVRSGQALAVSAGVTPGAVCSLLIVSIVLDQGADHSRIERDARAALMLALARTADQAAIERLRTGRRTVTDLSLSDLSAKVGLMVEGEMLSRDPVRFRIEAAALDAASAEDIVETGRRWLGTEPLVVAVHPRSPPQAPVEVERPARPVVTSHVHTFVDPAFSLKALDSGLTVITAPRTGARDFLIRLELTRGSAIERPDERGIGMLVAAMPYHGIGDYDAVALRRLTDEAGIQLVIGATAATFSVHLAGPSAAAGLATNMLADMVTKPRFVADILETRKREQINGLRAAEADVMNRAARLPLTLLYGADSAQTRRAEGSIASVEHVTLGGVFDHHRRLFDPAGATLLVVATPETLAIIDDAMTGLREGWTASAMPISIAESLRLPDRHHERIHFVRSGPTDQAIVSLATLLPTPEDARDEAATRAFANILQRRLGDRLREELRWTYGVGVRSIDAELAELPPRLEVQSAVGAEHAADAIAEIRAAVNGLADDLPPTDDELAGYRAQARAGLSGSIAGSGGVAAAIMVAVRPRWPIGLRDRIALLDTLDAAAVASIARRAISTGPFEWIVASRAPNVCEALASIGMPIEIVEPPEP